MKKCKIIVTGAAGQLGSELKAASSAYPDLDLIFLTKKELAIENSKEVDHFFNYIKPDFCINCAAYTAVDKAESDKENAFLINGTAPGILATACERFHSKLIHISTDYVFDGNAAIPYKEDSPTNPQTVYGASKLR